jgi:ribosomal protein S19
MTPDDITETWTVYDGSKWVEVEAAVVGREEFEAEVRNEAETLGNMVLQAEGCEHNTTCLGVFELQEAMVQGRPTYKQPGSDKKLYYNSNSNWMVGTDTSKTAGWWSVKSTAMTPDEITETWTVYSGSKWVEVDEAEVEPVD